jgi:hypothetical protein
VRKDLSPGQQVVQTAHACIEAAKSFLNNDLDHPHLVVIGVNNLHKLNAAVARLNEAGVGHRAFFESDLNEEMTAVCTEPVFGEQRRFFRKYQLLHGFKETKRQLPRP